MANSLRRYLHIVKLIIIACTQGWTDILIGFKGKLEIQVAKEIKAIGYRTIITEEDRMEEGGGGIITEIEIKSGETKIEMR